MAVAFAGAPEMPLARTLGIARSHALRLQSVLSEVAACRDKCSFISTITSAMATTAAIAGGVTDWNDVMLVARAAALQAAHITRLWICFRRRKHLDKTRAASLAAITDPEFAIPQEIARGQIVADQIWAWQSQKGFSVMPRRYFGGTDPGQWRPTAPAGFARTRAPTRDNDSLGPQLTFSIPSLWAVNLNRDHYRADSNEIRDMGAPPPPADGRPGSLRQSLAGQQSPDWFDPLLISLARRHNFTILRTARVRAVVNLGTADAMIGCRDAKYTYSFWRRLRPKA